MASYNSTYNMFITRAKPGRVAIILIKLIIIIIIIKCEKIYTWNAYKNGIKFFACGHNTVDFLGLR